MRILITGGGGFLAGHLAAFLQTIPGVELQSLARADCDLSTDQQRSARILKSFQPAVIFHLAGRISGSESDLDRDNRLATANLLESVREQCAGAKVVLASTTGIYRDPGTATSPMQESAEIAGRGAYAASKIAAEQECIRHAAGGGWSAIARISNPIGVHMPRTLLCGTLAAQIVGIERGEAPVVTLRTLSPKRDFLAASDCALALWQIASRGEKGETYNVASGVSLAIAGIVDIYRELAKVRPIEIRPLAGENERSAVQEQWLSNAKLQALGWRIEVSTRNAIREQLDAERARA